MGCRAARCLVVVVGRIVNTKVEPRAAVQDAAGVRVGAESPLAVILAHTGVADAAERQIMNEGLKRAIVHHRA